MNNTANTTPMTIEDLQKLCILQQQQIAELTAKLNWFEEQLRLSKHRQFGSSSEQTDLEQQQLF
jgi:transposase